MVKKLKIINQKGFLNRASKQTVILLGAILILFIATYSIYKAQSQKKSLPVPITNTISIPTGSLQLTPTSIEAGIPSQSIIQNQNTGIFTGVITDVDTSCNHDGLCKVKVGNIWIVTNLVGDMSPGMGARKRPQGKIIRVDGTITGSVGKESIGKRVEVKAKFIDSNNLTLYGSDNYYIKFLE